MNSSQDTQINTNAILEAIAGLRQHIDNSISGLRQEMNQRFNNVEARLRFVEDKTTKIEGDVAQLKTDVAQLKTDVAQLKSDSAQMKSDLEQVKNLQFVFENELDRLLSIGHQALHLAHENRADVRIMRKEVESWTQDVRELQRQAA